MYEAKIILDSVGPNGARLTTFELQYPRIVHAELMTHRVFSRNSASSRAIPTERLLERIERDSVLPVWWGKNQSGMQAREELSDDHDGTEWDNASSPRSRAAAEWLRARTSAVAFARKLGGPFGLHKQIANRVVEPWMFITVVVTATELSNFFALRDHADAQPELADVAGKAHRLWRASVPQKLESGQWHLPYVTGFDQDDLGKGFTIEEICKVSIGRCAAVSYLNQDKRDPPADLARADKLEKSGHMSPFEHVAQALTSLEWESYAEELGRGWVYHRVPVGNLWGWQQYRKTILDEHDFARQR
jgi:hypothetical protein